MSKIVVTTLIALALVGCTIGKDYRRPEVESPKAWRFEEKDAREISNTIWWEQFNDPALNDLIRTALRENKDILTASARVEEFLGRYGATRADLFPQAGAGASAGRQRVTEEGYVPVYFSPTYNTFQGAFSASWEIDVWGKLRRATEAARADLLSTEEARRAVVLTLVTAVANGYVSLLNLDQQLEIARQTVKVREESLKLFELRFSGGLISEVELSQVKSDYEQTRATIPQIEKSIAQQENALNALVGRNPSPIRRGRSMEQLVLPAVPAGLPSDLLERRPDIRQAEQGLIAANARIAVAKAQYFPSISLTGLFGASSEDLSNLFHGAAKVWNYTGNVTVPIFTAGRISGQVQAAEAVRRQALYGYQQAIQTAFREVEDALVDQRKSREKFEYESRQIEALRTYRNLASMRYENGYSSYLEVLDANRNLFAAELSHIQTKGNLFQAVVNLYKAMGGGWIVEAEKVQVNPVPYSR